MVVIAATCCYIFRGRPFSALLFQTAFVFIQPVNVLFPVIKANVIAPSVLTAARLNDLVSHSRALKGCPSLPSAGADTLCWPSGSLVRRSSTGSRRSSWAITSLKHISSRYSMICLRSHAPTQLWSGCRVMNIYAVSVRSRVSVRKSGFPRLSCKACGYRTARRVSRRLSLHFGTSTLPTSR